MRAPTLALAALLIPIALCSALRVHLQWDWLSSVTGSMTLTISWWVGLLASLLSYRLAEHSLAKFPGPLPARISKLWHLYQCGHLNNYWFLYTQHETHGPIVRVGEKTQQLYLNDNPDFP